MSRPLEALYVGREGAEKGLGVLVEAVESVSGPGEPPIHVAVVGRLPSSHPAVLRSLSRSIPMSFLGALENDEVRALMSQADVLVVPSLYDAAPVALIEALAEGTPAIASDVGGIPEILRDGVEGLLVEPGNPADLARALREFASRRGEWPQFRGRARRRGEENVWPVRAKELMALYHSVLEVPAA